MPSHLTQSKNQTLLSRASKSLLWWPPHPPTLLPFSASLGATLASFLFLKHAGSLLPQDVCICCFIPPRFQKGMCLYSKFQNFQKSPSQTYLDHSTKTSDPTLPHHSLSPHPALLFLIALMTLISFVMFWGQGLVLLICSIWKMTWHGEVLTIYSLNE